MVRGRQAGVVRDFQSTPTVQQKPGTMGGADSVRTASLCHGGTRGGHVGSPVQNRVQSGMKGGHEEEFKRVRDEKQSGHKVNRDKKGCGMGREKENRMGRREGEKETEFVKQCSAHADSIPSCKRHSKLIHLIFLLIES